jgi:DNA mismatch endonuclease (patch repair protein)
MQSIRARGNKTTELALVKIFRRHGITGWRRHVPLPGTPDFVFRKQKLVLFVDGCFWHGCPVHSRHVTKSGSYWVAKIKANRARDRKVKALLESLGWRVVRVWEHELTNVGEKALVVRLQKALNQDLLF